MVLDGYTMQHLIRRTMLLVTLSITAVYIVTGTLAADWLTACTESGFQPEQLACQTCTVLPNEFVEQCERCCQSWLDVKRIAKPYAAAVLVDRGSSGDVETFFKENWHEVLAIKGAHQLQKIDTPREQKYQFFMARPSQVLFFDDSSSIITGNKLKVDLSTLMETAKEVVNLDGMKREDIKDMLLTLLP
jgi:hypothetical protein